MSDFDLVTGGLGFLGSRLVAELRARGRRVRILDDLSTGDPRTPAQFARDAEIEVRIGSTLDEEATRDAVRGAARVFHLAAVVGVRRVASDPAGTLDANVRGAEAVIGACEDEGRPLLFVSSSEVYGEGGARRRLREDDAPGFDAQRAPFDGRCAYALSKWLGETRAAEASRRGLRVVRVRPFNVVGAGQSEESGSIVPSLVAAALRGDPLPIHGDGGATRAFASVGEVARAFVCLLDEPAAYGQAVNVGGTDVRSVAGVVDAVRRLTGLGPEAVRAQEGPRVLAIRHRLPDLARLRRLLGWVPSAPLEASIGDAIGAASGAMRIVA